MKRPNDIRADDWSKLPIPKQPEAIEAQPANRSEDEDPTESERRLQPELNRVKPVEKKAPIDNEFEIEPPDDIEEDAVRMRPFRRRDSAGFRTG